MPTGYTAGVKDGEVMEFRDYALQCARAFGALVMMRDDPADAPIPDEFKASDHHDKRLAEAQVELTKLRTLTDSQAATLAKAANKMAVAEWREREARRTAERARYEAMLAKVEAWEPPTGEHVELKKFMADQLRQSIDWDCGKADEKPAAMTGAEWLAAQIKSAEWDVEYYTRHAAEEKQRAADRTAWVRALKDSLDPSPAVVG